MKRSGPLKRRTPLAPVGRKARREVAPLAAFRAALLARSGGVCEAHASPDCGVLGSQAHHKCPADRDRGVHDPARGLFVCSPCHRAIHAFPAVSYEAGWLIRDGAE